MQRIKGIVLIQEDQETTQGVTTKIKALNYKYYIIAVLCVTAFFAYEMIPSQSQEFLLAKQKHIEAKSKRTEALKILKQKAEGSHEYNSYYVEKQNTDLAWKELTEIAEKEKFIGFDNLQQFLGEFGWIFGLLIYTIFNFSMSRIKNSGSRRGELALHSTLMFISLYYIGWCFNFTQDFHKSIYILACLFSTSLVLVGTSLLIKAKIQHFNSLMLNIKDLIGFMFNNTKEESEDEMWEVLKNVKHDR